MKSQVQQLILNGYILILNGYMPHYFYISPRGGTLIYDTEAVDNDYEAIMFAELLGPK